MKNIWKIVPVLIPVLAFGTVALGAAVSLSGYEAPVYQTEDFRVASADSGLSETIIVPEEEEEIPEETPAAGAFDLEDGIYEGSAKGFSGTVKVSVEIKDKSITAINILSHKDDAAFFNRAKAVIDRILASQSLDVDTVSGATYSSKGIINAVKNALTGEKDTAAQTIAQGDFDLADGIYEGTGTGFGGPVKVSVEIKNRTIVAVNVLSHSDDAAFFDRAKEGVIGSILSTQKLDVDTVSGATFSSKGIISAVKNALTGETEGGVVIGQGDFDLEDGIYEGSAQGFSGKVKVSVEIKDRTIVAVEILSYKDDESFFNRAKGVIDDILANQDLDNVDTVSGATYSSNGIINAIKDALGLGDDDDDEEIVIGKGDFDLKDGTYTGVGEGFRGDVKVSVKIENRTITEIQILSHSDDDTFFGQARDGVVKSILEQQKLDVDTVSGATYSSRGIISAVKNALTGKDDEKEPAVEEIEEPSAYKDGTYTGTGTGFAGELTVQVKISKGKIKTIKITKTSDGDSYIKKASALTSTIIKKQSTNVDAISGATYSSAGIIEAVRDALKKAAVTDPEPEPNPEPEIPANAFPYPDGIYTGVGEGYGGDITVSVVIQDKTMKAILITGHENEDDTFFNRAKTLADQIVSTQSVSVDTISGATLSSRGILEAVNNALEQAKKAAAGEPVQPPAPDNGEQPDDGSNPGTDTSGESVYYGVVTCSPDAYEDFEAYHLHVKVVFQNGKVREVSDVYGDGDSGNDSYIRKAVQGSTKYPGVASQIVAKNGVDGVDTISGATCSSKAVVDAVDILLKAASRDGNYTAGAGGGSDGQPGDDNSGNEGDGSEGDENPGDEGDGSEGDGNPGDEGDGSEEGGNPGGEGDSSEEGGNPGDEGDGSEGGDNSGDEGDGSEGGDNSGDEGDGSEGGDNSGGEGDGSEGGDGSGDEEDHFVYENGEYNVSVTCEPDEWWDFDPYNLTLTLVMENDTITEIKNISGDGGSENDYYIKRAMNGTKTKPGVVSQILEKNSTDGIDTISGATCSSNAIIDACVQALKSAEKQKGQE